MAWSADEMGGWCVDLSLPAFRICLRTPLKTLLAAVNSVSCIISHIRPGGGLINVAIKPCQKSSVAADAVQLSFGCSNGCRSIAPNSLPKVSLSIPDTSSFNESLSASTVCLISREMFSGSTLASEAPGLVLCRLLGFCFAGELELADFFRRHFTIAVFNGQI